MATENIRDESQILADQDQTMKHDLAKLDENMGAMSNSLEAIENEPEDFMNGEIDVKEQMDRARQAMAYSIHGVQEARSEDDPQSELNASFKNTPGGLDEMIMHTDEKNLHESNK